MQLHTLQAKKTALTKKKKRIGRGGKRGTYSGRGQKGQRARAGHRIRPAERDLIMRFPKLRGVKNKRKTPRAVTVNVGELARLFPEASELNLTVFVEAGIIRKRNEAVKILGGGEVRKAYAITGIPLSASARKKIEKAGGKAQA